MIGNIIAFITAASIAMIMVLVPFFAVYDPDGRLRDEWVLWALIAGMGTTTFVPMLIMILDLDRIIPRLVSSWVSAWHRKRRSRLPSARIIR